MRKCVIIIILLLSAYSTFAQNSGWKFSLGFDPMITWLSAKDNLKSDGSRLGFDFSLHAENYFHNRYAFYTGLTFMNTGGKLINNSSSELKFNHFNLQPNSKTALSAQYLVVPVGIKLHTAEFGLLSFYFNGGLYTGVRVGGSIKNPVNNEKQSISGDVNLITAGLQLGLGTMYMLGNGTYLQGGVKFNYGFVDMLKTSALNGQPVGIGLHLGILF